VRVDLTYWRHLLVLITVAFGLTGSTVPIRTLSQDAYIWQRRWTPQLDLAIQSSTTLLHGWRVLVAETGRDHHLTPVQIDADSLKASGLSVILVVRIDGELPKGKHEDLLTGIRESIERTRALGLGVAGLEIDHDCPTSQLATYRSFLVELRQVAGPSLRLGITALPTWLDSPRLAELLADVDEAVLQVHAVRNPHDGLFDASSARAWIARFARIAPRPFRVALPAYGSRVSWSEDGALLSVESERPTLVSGASASELIADPQEVASLLAWLRTAGPSNISGVVWFRLPVEGDRRAWSLPTWRAVIEGWPLDDRIEARLVPGVAPGSQDVILINNGIADGPLPRSVAIASGCQLADGIGGYELEQVGFAATFRRVQTGLLRSGEERTIGWVRCRDGKVAMHVEP
jgi:hypothetical protein